MIVREDNVPRITMKEVAAFRERATVGMTVHIPKATDANSKSRTVNGWQRTSIRQKAPYVAVTLKGTFRWADLCRWETEHAAL